MNTHIYDYLKLIRTTFTLEIALLFLFYEIFGVVTNLVGGWLGAHVDTIFPNRP